MRYLTRDPGREDVLSVFAGIRPLVAAQDAPAAETSKISREHQIHVSGSGLLTIAGGKWTTYRKMAEDVVDHAAVLAGLEPRECVTRTLNVHGHHANAERFGPLALYGADAPALREVMEERPEYGQLLHPRLPVRVGEIAWAARHEMARTLDDALARRTRSLVLDARAAIEAAPAAARVLARELGREASWFDHQVEAFRELAAGYLP